MRRAWGLAVATALLLAALPAGAADARARWDTRVLARISQPGFPAFAFAHPNGRIYEGTYDNPAGDAMRSRVLEYTQDGTLMRSWVLEGQDLSMAHGVQVANSDARGRLILLDKSPPRALVLDPATGKQSVYATFPDLPVCSGAPAGAACSPAARDEAPFPDYGAWGPDGSLYVTDYDQAVLFRVPPHGGAAQVWLADHKLDGDMFGTAGIALSADRKSLVISQGSSAGGGEPNPTTGKLYRVPIAADGKPGPLQKLWESLPADAPDGFGIARSGRIYVSLVSPSANQIAVVGTDGKEVERFPSSPGSGSNNSAVPLDSPSSATFLGSRILVANQAYVSGDFTHMAILDVETGEPGLETYVPPNAGPAEPKAKAPAKKKKKKKKRHRHHH